jgi:hypothetical protein
MANREVDARQGPAEWHAAATARRPDNRPFRDQQLNPWDRMDSISECDAAAPG